MSESASVLEGNATYRHESGEVIDTTSGTAACFPAGWSGTCEVEETVRKLYMIR